MVCSLVRGLAGNRLMFGEQGGVALIMLIAFIGLAVPITIASLQTSAQLSRNSRIYDARLSGMYNASSGVEVALHQLLSDPTFDDDLTPSNPDKTITPEISGESVAVTVSKVYTSNSVEGQGLVVSKSVTPTTAPVDTATTFTYTITIKNEGTGTATLEKLRDFLPPRFSYDSSSTGGDITSSNPDIDFNAGELMCGDRPDELTWELSPKANIGPQETKTLTFRANATLTDGTYYNQAQAKYEPWWEDDDIETSSPYEAEVTVATGTPKCGFDMEVLVSKTVAVQEVDTGVETQFAYTITFENNTTQTMWLCELTDWLPATFNYDFTVIPTGDIDRHPEEVEWKSDEGRYRAKWDKDQWPENNEDYILAIGAGATKSFSFTAKATLEPGGKYYNEVEIEYSDLSDCDDDVEPNGGASGDAAVWAVPMYDIQAVAADGTVLARVVLSAINGDVDILSWQEY